MAEGIILSSGSIGTKPEDLAAVLEQHGYEVDQSETQEPKREDFQDDESFNAAVAEHQEKNPPQVESNGKAEEPPKKTRIQKAFSKKVEDSKEYKELHGKTLALEAEIAELKKAKFAEPPKPVVKPEAETKKPVRADFPQGDAGQEQFEDALFDWRSAQRQKKDQEKSAATQQKEQQEKINLDIQQSFDKYHERAKEFEKTHADFKSSLEACKDVPFSTTCQIAAAKLENGPEVMYYLAKNLDVVGELAKLDDLSAVMEIGRISDRLKSSSSSRANGGNNGQVKVRLPEPVKPVSTAATASTLTTADAAANGNFRAFKAARRRGR